MTPEFGAVPTTTGQMVAGLKRDPHDQNLSMRLFTLDTTLVSIHKWNEDTSGFPIQKWMIFYKFKEINELRGGVQLHAVQTIPQIDADIVKKGHFWMETILSEPYDGNHRPFERLSLNTDWKERGI